jgi:hypothetical protein
LLRPDFGFDPPEILGMVKVMDGVTILVGSYPGRFDPSPLLTEVGFLVDQAGPTARWP